MKQLAMLCFFMCVMPFCFSQEVIIFNDINVDKKDIKVAQTVTGIEFSSDFIRLFPGTYITNFSGTIENHLSYFHESRIGNTMSLNKSIGFGNAFYRIRENINNSNSYASGNVVSQYRLSLDLKIEPRWYFNLRARYKQNKNTRNNSGWFLSVPLELSTNLLHQPVTGYTLQWLPEHLTFSIITPPTIGYRNSIGQKWFMEVSAGYIPVRAWFYDGSFIIKSSAKIGLFSVDSFNSELKIAYTF